MVWTPITILPVARETSPYFVLATRSNWSSCSKKRCVFILTCSWTRNWANMMVMVNNKMGLWWCFDLKESNLARLLEGLWASWVSACVSWRGLWWSRLQFSKHNACHLPLQVPICLTASTLPSPAVKSSPSGLFPKSSCIFAAAMSTNLRSLIGYSTWPCWRFDQSLLQLMGGDLSRVFGASKKKADDF